MVVVAAIPMVGILANSWVRPANLAHSRMRRTKQLFGRPVQELVKAEQVGAS